MSCATGMTCLLPRVGADPGRLVWHDESGIDLAWRGIDNLKSQGASARMPYWLSLFADLPARSYRPDAARAILDAALADGQAHHDTWWLPER